MLWALLIGYVLYGSGGGVNPGVLTANDLDIIDQRIVMEIADSDRADGVIEIVSGMRSDIERFRKEFNKNGEALGKYYKNHDVGIEEMQIILDAINEDWLTAQQDIVDAHFTIRQTLTEDEWSRVYRQSAQ